VETVHYRRGSQRSQRHAPTREAAWGRVRPNEEGTAVPIQRCKKGTAWKLFRPACTDSVPSFSCFHISSMLISNGDQKMNPYTQWRDLPRRPAPSPPVRLGLPAVHKSKSTGRESTFANHESSLTHHSSLATQHRRFLIGYAAIKNRRIPLKQNAMFFSNRPKTPYLRAPFSRLLCAADHQSRFSWRNPEVCMLPPCKRHCRGGSQSRPYKPDTSRQD
jgi:hypothetical protein